jgi:ferritin-like metal-binding protein YciE
LIGSTLVDGDPHYFSRAITTADKNLNDLCLDTLREIYYAEKQICKSLPKMAKAAQSDELRAAFEKRHGETEGQIQRPEQVFELLDKPPAAKSATRSRDSSMRAKRSWRSNKGTSALDAVLLAAAQAIVS